MMEIFPASLSDSEKVIWGGVAIIVTGLITKSVVGVVKYLNDRRENAIKLDAKFSVGASEELLGLAGCPCMLLRLSCSGKRSTKIERATLCLRGFDPMPLFQEAHGTDFGYRPKGGKPDPDAVFFIHFLPLSKPTRNQGFELERDDSCDFFLPLFITGITRFVDAPSEDVYIRVTLFDGTEMKVMQGLEVQSIIRSMVETYSRRDWNLNLDLQIEFGAIVKSVSPPDLSHVGKSNPNPLRLDDETPRDFKSAP